MPGTTVVKRDVFRGKTWAAYPFRVIQDTGSTLVTAMWPGTLGVGPTSWITAMETGDPAAREKLIPELARNDWHLGSWSWRRTVLLSFAYFDRYFGVNLMFDTAGDLLCWYINFELPSIRTKIGVDTCDLQLDLVVNPDFSYRWKDEDEYVHARRMGIIDDAWHTRVEQARGEAIDMIENRRGPFAKDDRWDQWRRDPEWPIPVLPENVS